MPDLPPMAKCPVGRKGRHSIAAILPEDETGDVTWFCERCGALRRTPVAGPLLAERLDDLTAAEIAALVR